jgi:hypothetical protein
LRQFSNIEKETIDMLTMLKKSIPAARTVLGILAATLLLAPVAFTQSDTVVSPASSQSFLVDYFTNNRAVVGASIPDAQMHVLNAGFTGGFDNGATSNSSFPSGGDLCVNIYVFDPAQEMKECCSCLLSPNGMMGFSLATDLTSSSVTGVVPRAGDIKIVSSFGANASWASLPSPTGTAVDGQPCDNSGSTNGRVAAGTLYTPVGELQAWLTHVRPLASGVAPAVVTETAFADATLSASELRKLQQKCFSILAPPGSGGLGSGAGKCTCGGLF